MTRCTMPDKSSWIACAEEVGRMFRTLAVVNVVTFGLATAVLIPVESRADHVSIPVERLQIYSKLDPSGVTVSGISSGAFFAHQFHVAFSRACSTLNFRTGIAFCPS